MFRRCGVGSYRGGQSLGRPDPNSDSDTYGDPNSYADANSVTRALCTRCQCGH